MKCPYCDNEVPANAANCPSCGAVVPQQQQPQYAPPPPQYTQPQYAPPPQQQVVVQVAPQQQVSDKSRVAYILLGLFLGGLGIHNFYAGRTGAGVAQLLIVLLTGWLVFPAVIVGIWVLLEIITVSKDGQGRPFC